jgi:TetR/AcrR family fatty acid metabolism transcriptional regulator
LIHRHLALYEDNPDYANVVMLILKGNPNFLKTESYRVVQSSARNYIQVLEEGIESNEFRPDMDPYVIRAMIWGSIEHLVTRKSLLGKPESLTDLTETLFNTLFNGIRATPEQPPVHINVHMSRSE